MGERIVKALTAVLVAGVFFFSSCSYQSGTQRLYVGTYGEKAYEYEFSAGDFKATLVKTFPVENSSYILVSDVIHNLYALTESGPSSAVSAFTPEGDSINTQLIPDANPCYVINYHNHIITANYSGGSISVLPIDVKTGALLQPSQTLVFTGSGPVERRQTSSHIHTVAVINTLEGDYLLATDLGGDRIYIMQMVYNEGSLMLLPSQNQSEIILPSGSGPRHIAVHPSENIFYVLCELSGMVLSYKYDDALRCRMYQAVPSDRSGAQASGDIHIDPSGSFLYTSARNTGDDGLKIFKIDKKSGFLKSIGHIDTFPHPRNFTFTPDGQYLLVASKDRCCIQIFKVDKNCGRLINTRKVIDTSPEQPVCLVFK